MENILKSNDASYVTILTIWYCGVKCVKSGGACTSGCKEPNHGIDHLLSILKTDFYFCHCDTADLTHFLFTVYLRRSLMRLL